MRAKFETLCGCEQWREIEGVNQCPEFVSLSFVNQKAVMNVRPGSRRFKLVEIVNGCNGSYLHYMEVE